MDKTYSGAESGVGSHYAWSGNRKVGTGSMDMTDAKENTRVEIALEFLKPFKSTSVTALSLQPEGNGTNVAWTMTGKKTFMMRIMGIFKSMDSLIGPDFEKGLGRLKTAAEA